MSNKLELIWYGKENQINVEPRILIENSKLSNTDRDSNTENMLIHGDNLLALKALEAHYTGKIKCIYIDPPYNTGSAFDNYDDNLEHSIWLTLMSNRLIILERLMSQDSMIFIQIDDNEQAYLKVLCDEVFGRNNFINCISVKMSPSSGLKRAHKDKGFIKNKEYILIYGKGSPRIKPLYDEWTKFDTHYSTWFDGEKYDSLLNIIKSNFNDKHLKYDYFLLNQDVYDFILSNCNKIYRTHDPSAWAVMNVSNGTILFENHKFKIVQSYNPDGGGLFELLKSKNNFTGWDRLEPLSWNFFDGKLSTLRGDFWPGYEKDMGNVSKEGGVKMPMSKKPERLIYDIISCCTADGDYVLDSFLGSGTTASVAHKMNRKWIGIEMGDHAYSLDKVRLDNVINGEQTGVSEKCKWNGGGGYKFYELAPTLIKKDFFGQEIINSEYNGEMLAAAVSIHEGYSYQPDKQCFWKQSVSDNNSYLFVTTKHVTKELIDSILLEMNDEFLLIVCKSFDANVVGSIKNIKIKKIPQSLLENCEFDVDNYNLNIICPPEYEEEDDE